MVDGQNPEPVDMMRIHENVIKYLTVFEPPKGVRDMAISASEDGTICQ